MTSHRDPGLPTFLIIGAMKSGTTALYHALRQHPDIWMSPEKEPHFFAFEDQEIPYAGPRDRYILESMTVRDIAAYRRLFEPGAAKAAAGEASVMYLYLPHVPPRVKERVPTARLIALLRNPVDRAYSSYMHMVRD